MLKQKERSSQDEMEILKEIVNSNKDLREKVIERIRQLRRQNRQSLEEVVAGRMPEGLDAFNPKK